jgi:hypothetical protein
MGFNRLAPAFVAGALGVAGFGTAASAADLLVKAPPPPPIVELDMHAFFDISFKNAYITPRGLLVTKDGLTTQILTGLSADVYKDKGGFINLVSVYGYVWNDLWSEQNHPTVGSWNEFDWAVGMSVKFAQNWKFGVEYVEFLSPPGNFSIERNIEFTLAYDDSSWWGNAGFAINPYVKLFYAVSSGSSTVVTGKAGGTYDVEIGIVPTLSLKKYTGLPLTISAPTWVTVGPTDYWNSGFFNNALGTGNRGCGGVAVFCDTDGVGVFSTGLTAKLGLDWMPKRFGSWYVKAGFQYYDFLNDNLQLAQTATLGVPFAQTHKDYVVGFGGLGFSF